MDQIVLAINTVIGTILHAGSSGSSNLALLLGLI